MRRLLTATVILIVLTSASFAADIHVPEPALPTPLTLQDAIAIGLRNQSAVGIAGYQAVAARAGVTIANSPYFPQVTPSFTYNSQRTTGPASGFNPTGTGTLDGANQTTQLSLRQLLADNGTRDETAAASRNAARASQYGLEGTRQAVVLNIATSYYDLLRNKELAKVAQANVDSAKTTLDATTAEADAGTIARKDILQAQANYENAVVQQITANNNVSIAEVTLKNAMGVYGPQPIVTPDSTVQRPSPTADTKSAGDYLKMAIDNRPDIQRASNLIDESRHNEHVANLAASVQVQAVASDVLQSQPDRTTDRLLSLGVSYPLFDAGSSRARVRQAESSLEQTRLQAAQTVEDAQQSVTQAYLQREAARQATVASAAALTAARENFIAAQDSQKEGVSTIVDVITAQAALVTAETNDVEATYNYYIADQQLSRAIGTNDPGTRQEGIR